MRRMLASVALSLSVAAGRADEKPPLVERYLHAGELALGEHALQRALNDSPTDDQLRFGLGVLRFVRGLERLGQSLHEHGVKSESTSLPFLRLPVPANPDPTPITYPILRRVIEQFTDDLARAEATLAGVTDDAVVLPLHLAEVRMDFAGDGQSKVALLDILKKLMRQERFAFLEKNPRFQVRFDRGDVAWLRAYCHLLSAMADAYLAIDGKFLFDLYADDHFVRPKGQAATRPDLAAVLLSGGIRFSHPARLHSLRRHLIRVCELNQESWRYIRSETDDDHEWLPNAMQKGVLGLSVRDDQIDGWLTAMDELAALLRGDKLLAVPLPGVVGEGMGVNVRAVLDDPPASLDVAKISRTGVEAKYLGRLTEQNRYDDRAFGRVLSLFDGSLGFAYLAWFN